MTRHRFVVNVPNPGPRGASVELSLKPADPNVLAALGFPGPFQQLRVIGAAISLDPCADGGPDKLRLKLGAQESVDVFVAITTEGNDGAALFHLEDHRAGRETGGVLLACVEGQSVDPPGTIVEPAHPCPAKLGRDPYPMGGDDPSVQPADASMPVTGRETTIVFPVHNPTHFVLENAFAYLEHLGVADAVFEPGTWHIGDLGAGDTFFATWPIRVFRAFGSPLVPCIVVGSSNTDPVRLRGSIRLRERAVGGTARRPRG